MSTYFASRRCTSRSTASRMKSDRFSPPASKASMRASVPPGNRAGVCSSLMRGLPTGGRVGDITFFVEKGIFLISPIDRVSDISYLDDIRYGGKTMTTAIITITGLREHANCDCCGRSLRYGITTNDLGVIGADCLVSKVVVNRKRWNAGKPTASMLRDFAKAADGIGPLRGRLPSHALNLEIAA